MDFETAVKLNLYQAIAETTRTPDAAEVARALRSSPARVEEALATLAGKRLLDSEYDSGRIPVWGAVAGDTLVPE